MFSSLLDRLTRHYTKDIGIRMNLTIWLGIGRNSQIAFQIFMTVDKIDQFSMNFANPISQYLTCTEFQLVFEKSKNRKLNQLKTNLVIFIW